MPEPCIPVLCKGVLAGHAGQGQVGSSQACSLRTGCGCSSAAASTSWLALQGVDIWRPPTNHSSPHTPHHPHTPSAIPHTPPPLPTCTNPPETTQSPHSCLPGTAPGARSCCCLAPVLFALHAKGACWGNRSTVEMIWPDTRASLEDPLLICLRAQSAFFLQVIF